MAAPDLSKYKRNRELSPLETEKVLSLMDLCEPYATTNNQHSSADYYLIGGRTYVYHSFENFFFITEEINEHVYKNTR